MGELQKILGDKARGTFGPTTHIDAAQAKQNVEAFLRPVSQPIPGICGDERGDQHGNRLRLPASFGGLAGLVIADALTTRHWYQPRISLADHIRAMYPEIIRLFPEATLVLHTDDHAVKDGSAECGCAAIARAPAIVQLLTEESDLTDAMYRDQVITNAKSLLASGYFLPGTAKMVDTLVQELGAAQEVLTGPHNGVIFIENQRPGYIVDRLALYARQPLYAFEYDKWAVRNAAAGLAPDKADFYFAGADAFNMATMYAIGAADMPIITIK